MPFRDRPLFLALAIYQFSNVRHYELETTSDSEATPLANLIVSGVGHCFRLLAGNDGSSLRSESITGSNEHSICEL